TEIPPERWAYVDARTIRLLPEGTAFRPGFIYDFWYPAHNPKVLGMCYAATRDLVAFLRYQAHDTAGNVNPVALSPADPGILAVLAYGDSQRGRSLRGHLGLRFNHDQGKTKT